MLITKIVSRETKNSLIVCRMFHVKQLQLQLRLGNLREALYQALIKDAGKTYAVAKTKENSKYAVYIDSCNNVK